MPNMDGIVGIYSPGDNGLVNKISLATTSIQNRGEDSAGIAVAGSEGIDVQNGLGTMGEVIKLDKIQLMQHTSPVAGLGNVGYTKNSPADPGSAEPIQIHPKFNSNIQLAITMDGYLLKEKGLKAELESDYNFHTRNKTEVVGALLHKYISEEGIGFDAGKRLVDKLHGRATFSLASLIHDGKDVHMIALNDDRAFEPLCYGTIDNAFVVSSESCSHDSLNGKIEREFDGAEMVICSPNTSPRIARLREEEMMPDSFRAVYFDDPSSMFRGREIFQIRADLGRGLIRHYGVPEVDVVIYNPDSGLGVTVGMLREMKDIVDEQAFDTSKMIIKERKAFELYRSLQTILPGLVKKPHASRTFQRGQVVVRFRLASTKFSGIQSLIKGMRLLEGDDSTVKGSVSEGGAVSVLRRCGAKTITCARSEPPMFFVSYKEWFLGPYGQKMLAVQRAFEGDNPYDKSLDEIDKAVARLTKVDRFMYNPPEVAKAIIGSASYQALDASYPISEEFWPDFIKVEVEKFRKYRSS